MCVWCGSTWDEKGCVYRTQCWIIEYANGLESHLDSTPDQENYHLNTLGQVTILLNLFAVKWPANLTGPLGGSIQEETL